MFVMLMNTVCTLKAESSLEEDFQESPLFFFFFFFSFSKALGESKEVLSKVSIFLASDHLILSLHIGARLATLQ